MVRPYSAALPIAYVALRILIVLNWLFCVFILGLLAFTFFDVAWTMEALGVASYPNAQLVLNAMRIVAVLGIAAIPLNHAILARLLAIVHTVRSGDPFVAANALRLQAVAWALLLLQLVSLVIGGIGKAISTSEHPVDLDAGFSVNGWLAVLFSFIIARVFAAGTLMREDLEGTV